MRVLLLALALLVACTGAAAHVSSQRSAAELKDVLKYNRETIGGPFALVDQQGRKRSDKDFRGKLLLVYFGYTTCPDICPTDLQQIGAAIESPSFHPRLVGLRGSDLAVHKAADAYRVYFKKVPIGTKGDYGFDHAAFTYLMDRDGKYLGYFPPGTSAARMAEVIRPHLWRAL